MELKEIKTSSDNIDFELLVAELDFHLTEFYGDEQDFFEKHNKVDNIKNVIIIYDNENPIGCGAIKEYSNSIMEIKRMYVNPEYRGLGIASKILLSLENWAIELGYSSTILETMKVKESVINMYSKNGYEIIPNYGQYEKMDKSVCMSKDISKKNA
jgi:GNAT superfamily N-acetyltransferase